MSIQITTDSRFPGKRHVSCFNKNIDISCDSENRTEMNYPVDTAPQLASVLRSLRRARKLTQADVGKKMGVSLKRISGIELNPGVTMFDQIARMVSVLGGRLVVVVENEPQSKARQSKSGAARAEW
jgi:HTH-type transcriptional regulator / antitoxin HipB